MRDAIFAEALTKRYGKTLAVDGLDLRVGDGELFALLGVNGAGKTTTISMLSGLIRPTSGDAHVLGASVTHETGDVKRRINVSPQETAVARNLSVTENLRLVAQIYGHDAKSARASAADVITRFGLGDVADRAAKKLSGGMQRRLSIAMALITSPSILFLDEPTLGLDVLARRELWASINALKGTMTVILTTHYMEEAQELADRVGVMVAGRLRACGTVAEMMAQTSTASLEDAFVVLAGGTGTRGLHGGDAPDRDSHAVEATGGDDRAGGAR
jgi:ABC-2 type transport system ATP-binding protein